tara:strand:+ start:188848 stop:189078 length:231 start_codon:yes stop_codon:yes gene_type:complete
MKKKLLFIVLGICLLVLSSEIYLVFNNNLREIEELIFSGLFIIFLAFVSIYILNSMYWNNETRKNWYDENNDLIDF